MRTSGVLLAVSSLPSAHGIGCFDRAAYDFVRSLYHAGQKLWQILPLGPTGYGDSPYQSFSTFAGNPYYIDLDNLVLNGWLTAEEAASGDEELDPRAVDYGRLYKLRQKLLKKAFSRSEISDLPEYNDFVRKNAEWLDDYSLFMAIKDASGELPWTKWDMPLRMRNPEALASAAEKYADMVNYHKFVQFVFYEQWNKLLSFAHEYEVQIVGDIPIYVAYDSADVWASPELFQLSKEERRPVEVSGCPPDAFAKDGQIWGHPLYDWEYHEKTGYSWWIKRIRHCLTTCDILRIDHFRGFDEYYAIPAKDKTAVNGRWRPGPGKKLFDAVHASLGKCEIIAEDLGYVTDSVRRLVADTGCSGIKVFEFAFDSRDTGKASDYLPHNYPVRSVAYTGTHDNAPLAAWYDEISKAERREVCDYLCVPCSKKAPCRAIICCVERSVADIAIVPMQDWLGLGKEARMNTPSTYGCNWKWRLLPGEFDSRLEEKMRRISCLFERCESFCSHAAQGHSLAN